MASKHQEIIYDVELGKPYVLPDVWVETSQEVTMVQRVKDTIESKSQSAMD